MTVFLWTALTFLGGLLMIALGDMVSEKVRHRLDHLPHAILRLAARRLDPALRVTLYEEAWLPDLAYILKGDEARPVTRLVHGTTYAMGILLTARRSAGHLQSAPAASPSDLPAPGPKRAIYKLVVRTHAYAERRLLAAEERLQRLESARQRLEAELRDGERPRDLGWKKLNRARVERHNAEAFAADITHMVEQGRKLLK